MCACVRVRASMRVCVQQRSVSYLGLESNSQGVLPSGGVLRLQLQCLEIGVDEEESEKYNKSTSIHGGELRWGERAHNSVNRHQPSAVVNHHHRRAILRHQLCV